MNEKTLYELNKIRNKRNSKLDIISERLSHCVVKSNQGVYSPMYLIHDYEAEEVLNKTFSNQFISSFSELNDFDEPFEKYLKSSIADSIYQAPEYPLGDEEVGFLYVDKENKEVKSIKIRNLFYKSQFNIVDFLKQISHIITDIISEIGTEDNSNNVAFIFKCACGIIFNVATLIQNMIVEFDEKYFEILNALITNDYGLIGIDINTFCDSILSVSDTSFVDINELNDHIDKLEKLGCIGIKSNEDSTKRIFIKEKIVKIKKSSTNEIEE